MNRCALYKCLLLWWLVAASAPMFATVHDAAADTLMMRFFSRREAGDYKMSECFGNLYIKQRVEVFENNLALNAFPDMTRFDKGVDSYVTELFYQFYYTKFGVQELRRKAHNTSFKHGRGEVERVVSFVKVNPCDDKLLQGRIFSPLHPDYQKYYIYTADSLSADGRRVRLSFTGRFDNIKLLSGGWLWLDDSCNVCEFAMNGWDEQNRFEAVYKMSAPGVVKSVHVDVDYDFFGNRLNMVAYGCFDYEYIALADGETTDGGYDVGTNLHVAWDTAKVVDAVAYAAEHRPMRLDADEVTLLANSKRGARPADAGQQHWMWGLGDAMVSSHTYDWDGGGVRLSPIINPSSVDYSSGRGLSYKLSMNVRSSLSENRALQLNPQLGYNFKQHAFYWSLRGNFIYAPLRRGVVGVDFGEGNRSYSSVMLDRIKSMALDSLKFENLNLNYFRNFYVEAFHEREIHKDLSLLTGVNFYRRIMRGNAGRQLDEYGVSIREKYVQFAPHLRLTWRPGTYYYIKEGQKINLDSKYPVVVWDVEQGVNGVAGSNSIYTRSELDVQYKMGVSGGNILYMRFGAGGYFYTKDVYFVDYSFLKQSNLPIERSEELGGVFQLLDSEWYNAANKYARAHLTYEAPFLSLQKLFPRVKFFRSEYIYYNMLFISHLCPYMELGYGVSTPYVNMGLFVSSQNEQIHRIGYKITLSLFTN